MINEVVVTRRMPPWNADSRFGKFSNDLRMPKEEIDKLVAWIDDGAPLGDEKDLPKPPTFAEGWTIGEPDVVLEMPEEYTVPASGTVEYQYFVTPTNFEQDVWVRSAEARPGTRSYITSSFSFARRTRSRFATCLRSPASRRARSRSSGLLVSASRSPPARNWSGRYTTRRREKSERTAAPWV
jgi:hypothetical protein